MKHFTGDIEFTCTPKLYFDTLRTFLLTNDRTDLGGRSKGVAGYFDSKRIYKKNVVKRSGHFYIDSIENSTYWVLLIECRLGAVSYTGYIRNLDFTNNDNDTLEIKLCVEPDFQIMRQE